MLHIVDNILILEDEITSDITFDNFSSLELELVKNCCTAYNDVIDLTQEKEWTVFLPLDNAIVRKVTFRNIITGKLYTLSGLAISIVDANSLQVTLTNSINTYLNTVEIDADNFTVINIALTSTTTANATNFSYELKDFLKHHIPYSVTYDVHIIGEPEPQSINNVSYFSYNNSQSNTYLNSQNNLYIFPKLISNTYFDNGIYTINIKLLSDDEELIYEKTKCIIVDYNLKEKIIELNDKNVLFAYYGLNNSADCDCDCEFKCEIYKLIENSLFKPEDNYTNECNCS